MKLIGALKAAKRTAPFYSAVDEALAAIKRPKGTGAEFYTELSKQAGVKKAELADRKLEQAFKAKGKMTKEEAQQVLADNPPPKLKEKVYDESTAIDENDLREMVSQEMFGKPYSQISFGSAQHRQISDEVYKRMDADNGTTHGVYRLPDGENYREILLKLPSERPYAGNYSDPAKYDADLRAYNASGKSDYQSSHFKDDANVLAHMRVQDRKGPNGEKILHVEEIQSDWHQAGRKKGYRNAEGLDAIELESKAITEERKNLVAELSAQETQNGFVSLENQKKWDKFKEKEYSFNQKNREFYDQVQDAPFKKNWHELAMKRLLNYAADNGYDSIAITPGKLQIDRYEQALRKNIDSLEYEPFINDDGKQMFEVAGFKNNKQVFSQEDVTPEQLQELMGKDTAQKISEGFGESLAQERPLRPEWKRIQSSDLSIGGEGMKGFYDKMLPDYLNTFGKPYGAQVQQLQIPIKHELEGLRRMAGMAEDPPLTLHNFPITQPMRESIKQKGLPLYQQVGIPTAGAGAASQMLEPEEEAGLATGGVVKSAVKQAQLAKLAKLREQMAPRAEAVKALIARDENRYLADVAPNSLTNAEIEAEIKRMAAKAPMFMKPSALTELRKIVQQEKGDYGSRRLERAADEVPNLEKMYTLDALKERFTGDNAKALMTMSPADFEKFATELQGKTSVGPKAAESAKQGDISKYTVPTSDYVKHLERIAMFDSVPYLNLAKEEVGLPLLPYISGHEGRHRSRALAGRGEKRNLVGITPTMDLREGLPRRSQEEFIEAMKKELELSGGLVLPQSEPMLGGRPPIILPDVYAKGGAVKLKVKDSKSGKVRMTENRDTMFMELSNKKLKRK
jgi:hypothetical protein